MTKSFYDEFMNKTFNDTLLHIQAIPLVYDKLTDKQKYKLLDAFEGSFKKLRSEIRPGYASNDEELL